MEISDQRFKRIGLGTFAVSGLALIYLFQYTDFLFLVFGGSFRPEYHFVVNRTVRIFINDSCMLMLIYALFMDRKVLKLAFYIQVVDLLVLFPLYLLLKLPHEGVSELSSPFLSQFHRLIVNPTLMILLIGGVYYQNVGMKKAI
jgi:exosortase F-associated protein